MILYLSKEKECIMSNSYISELLSITKIQSSRIISSLKKKGYIKVEMIYKENENVRNIVGLCKECLMENQLNLIIIKSKKLRDEIEKKLISIYGRKRWIIYWWEYNKN